MWIVAAVLSLLFATQPPASGVQTFLGHLQAGRNAEAYALLSPDAKKAFGRAQFDAYVASRTRVLGALSGVSNVRVSNVIESEHGMTIYEADVKFEKGTSPSWFVLAKEDAGWRVHRFGLDMPEGTTATSDANEVMPIVHELLAGVKKDGVPSLAPRFSAEDLKEAQQTPEQALEAFRFVGETVGRLDSYTLGKPQIDDEGCTVVKGETKFQYGDAPLTMRLCWSDGVWRLRHAHLEPMMNPAMIEHSISVALKGQVTVKCPRDAEIPVGGTIVCRLSAKGEPPQDATVLRTTNSGWKIVGLEPVK